LHQVPRGARADATFTATGQQVQAVAGLDQATVHQVIACCGEQIVGSLEGADVVQVLAGDQDYVVTGDQRAIRAKAAAGLGQVHHGHQHGFAVHHRVFHPHDVVGECRYIAGRLRAAKLAEHVPDSASLTAKDRGQA
jgi:hypothetical protein